MVQSGVRRAFGPQLRHFLGHTLQSRGKAFFAGLGVTSILQSSTATGLMAADFAAEGLVSLVPALSVMLGANVGTTLIVQLLSFDIAAVAPILVLVGVMLFRRSNAGWRDFGRVLIGLGLILLALHQFLTLLEPISSHPAARAILGRLSTHIVFIVLIGTVLAWAAHSSVAIVLLAMSLVGHAVLPLPAGIALALGANLGSALNPVLEGAGRGTAAARRLPMGNLITRLTGVGLILAAYPLVSPAVALIEADAARAVANFHTLFNLILAALFLPFLGPYSKMLERLLPSRGEAEAPGTPLYLNSGARGSPPSALGAAAREALRLADTLEAMLGALRNALHSADRAQIEEGRALDDVLDRLTTAIKDYLLSIDPARMSEADGRMQARILAFAINLEQAGDLISRNLLPMVMRRLKRGVSFSAEGEADLVGQVDRLLVNLHAAAALFVGGDERAAHALAGEKERFREFEEQAMAAHFQRLRSGDGDAVETSGLHLDALRDLKRLNAHLVEAAAYPILRQRGDLLPSRVRRLAPRGLV